MMNPESLKKHADIEAKKLRLLLSKYSFSIMVTREHCNQGLNFAYPRNFCEKPKRNTIAKYVQN